MTPRSRDQQLYSFLPMNFSGLSHADLIFESVQQLQRSGGGGGIVSEQSCNINAPGRRGLSGLFRTWNLLM